MTDAINSPRRAPVQAEPHRGERDAFSRPGSISWEDHERACFAWRRRHRYPDDEHHSADLIAARGGFSATELLRYLGGKIPSWQAETPRTAHLLARGVPYVDRFERGRPRLWFYGDARLPSNGMSGGHFCHLPDGVGGCWREGREPAWIQGWDALLPDASLLPHQRDPKDHGYCDGQAQGVMRYRRIHGHSVLSMWDRTGDGRGNCVAIFFTVESLSTTALLARVQHEYSELWARISAGRTMAWSGQSDPDPARATVETPVVTKPGGIPIDDAAPGMWERLYTPPSTSIPQETCAPTPHVAPRGAPLP